MVESTCRIVCAPRHLPRHEWPRAATNAIAVNPENRPPGLEVDELPVGSDGERLAIDVTRYWGKKGVRLTVNFFETPDQALRNRIILHLNAWGKTANVVFVESATEPRVRIARWTAKEAGPGENGYWSNLGTDILLIMANRPTMIHGVTYRMPIGRPSRLRNCSAPSHLRPDRRRAVGFRMRSRRQAKFESCISRVMRTSTQTTRYLRGF
jgi:hypothetical protein